MKVKKDYYIEQQLRHMVNNKMKIDLIYFKMRALAEAPQLLMHYLNIEYNYIMSWDYYGKEWQEVKSQIPFKQLPMIVVDDKHEICQSIAILKFIENIAGQKLKEPVLDAKANAILQSAQELFLPLNPAVNFAVGDDFIKRRDDMIPFLQTRFEELEKILKSNDNKFFINNEPRGCDFAAFHHFDLSKRLDEMIIKKFPRLEQFLDDISSLSSIENYLSKRPELIDVSIEPKLIIDGTAQPTGTQKT
jgi:glutathione S-transferase